MNTPPKVNTSNTKNEIYQAYQALVEQLEENQKQQQSSFPIQDETTAHQQQLIKNTEKMNADGITKDIEQFLKSFSQGMETIEQKCTQEFSKTSEKLTASLKQLREIQETIKIEEEQLKKIYGLKDASLSLTKFLQLQEAEKQKWEEEKKEHEKQRRREKEEYEYELAQKRKREESEYARKQEERKNIFESDIKRQHDELQAKQEMFKTKEAEFAELQKFRAEQESRQQKAIKEALEIQKKELQREFETDMMIEKHDRKAEKELLEQRIQNLEMLVKDKDKAVLTLRSEADRANQKAQELAVSVIQTQRKEYREQKAGSGE